MTRKGWLGRRQKNESEPEIDNAHGESSDHVEDVDIVQTGHDNVAIVATRDVIYQQGHREKTLEEAIAEIEPADVENHEFLIAIAKFKKGGDSTTIDPHVMWESTLETARHDFHGMHNVRVEVIDAVVRNEAEAIRVGNQLGTTILVWGVVTSSDGVASITTNFHNKLRWQTEEMLEDDPDFERPRQVVKVGGSDDIRSYAIQGPGDTAFVYYLVLAMLEYFKGSDPNILIEATNRAEQNWRWHWSAQRCGNPQLMWRMRKSSEQQKSLEDWLRKDY